MRKAILLLTILVFCIVAMSASSSSPRSTTNDDHGPNSPVAIDRERVGVVLIDAQPFFWKIMHGEREPVEARIEQLLLFADLWQLPIVATFEEPPAMNGWLPDRLEAVFPEHGQRHTKRHFDCCREPDILETLRDSGVEQIVVAGAETDVCVLQSVLGLIDAGFQVFLLEDCIFTNEPNTHPALARMRAAGAIPCTYKTFHYEVMQRVGNAQRDEAFTRRFQRLGRKLKSPYQLPPTLPVHN